MGFLNDCGTFAVQFLVVGKGVQEVGTVQSLPLCGRLI
ncbi:uncharacterized protein METZ01_LOCUS150850 [marine metagenome]|uniref:Uncharacterized protein n=1 Tax=marine metagenome TaxID=408172 RepID=A0A382A8X0_9ZZZZ